MVTHSPCSGSDARVLRRSPAVFALAVLLGAFAVSQQLSAQQPAALEPEAVALLLKRHGLGDPVGVRRRGGVWTAEVAAADGRRYTAVIDAQTGELAGLRPVPPVALQRREAAAEVRP